MSDEKIGAQPDSEIEPAEPNPGGADAIDEATPFAGDEREPLGRDLHPDHNPGVEDHVPDEIGEPDDKQQEGEGDGASDPEKEDPA